MSLCLNDRRNWLRVPPSLDLSPEINLIASWQAQWVTFSLPLRVLMPKPLAMAPGQGQMGHMS